MAKVEAVEIRPGQLLEWDKRVWRVLKAYHVHVGGRGGAFMQVEMKDIDKGTKTNQRFRTEDKIERAFVEPRDMQYLYQDGDSYVFMDQENYEQLSLSAEFLEGQSGYLMPEMKVQINFYNGRAIGIQLPPSVVMTIIDTEPGIKNSTATNSFKPAKMETGVTVQVPGFINTGDKIKIYTAEGTYMERA
jgi:elongation factor P